MPDTLGHILEGCMFFRRSRRWRWNWQDRRRPSRLSQIPPQPKEAWPEEGAGRRKLVALHNAGWPAAKIADELGVSTRAVYNYLPSKGLRQRGEYMYRNKEGYLDPTAVTRSGRQIGRRRICLGPSG